jgi:hypothetical protein
VDSDRSVRGTLVRGGDEMEGIGMGGACSAHVGDKLVQNSVRTTWRKSITWQTLACSGLY